MAVLLALALVSDDFEYARQLTERGLYDLAEETFAALSVDTALSPDQRAEGELGIALVRVLRARTLPTRDRLRELEAAGSVLDDFINAHPDHSRIAEACALRGESLREQARRSPKNAADLLKLAEKLDRERIQHLEVAVRRQRAGIEDNAEAPRRALEALDDQLSAARYGLGLTLYERADLLKDVAALDEAIKLLDDLTMDCNAYEGAILLGKAYGYMIRLSPREERAKLLSLLQSAFAMPIQLLDEKGSATNLAIRDLASRATLAEMETLNDLGEFSLALATPDSRGILKLYPPLATEDVGRRILIEEARALFGLRKTADAKKIVAQAVAGTPADSIYRILAFQIRPLADMTPDELIEGATALTAHNHFFFALLAWREAALRGGDAAARAWMAVGDLNAGMHRWHEAARAYAVLDDAPAALGRKSALESMAARTKDRSELDAWIAVIRDKYAPILRDDELIKAAWNAFDAKNLDGVLRAVAAIPPERTALQEEAAFIVAAAHYRIARDNAKALEAFEHHLTFEAKDADARKRRLTSIHVVTLLAKPERVLSVSDEVPPGDAKIRMDIYANRVDARLTLKDVAGAEKDLALLVEIFDRAKICPEKPARALMRVAGALMAAGEKKRAADLMVRALEIRDLDGDPSVLLPYADFLHKSGDFKRALGLYERARASSSMSAPDKEAVDLRIGECLVGMGDFDRAVHLYNDLTRDDVDITKIYLWQPLAETYRRLGRHADAAEVYSKLAGRVRRRDDARYWEFLHAWAESTLDAADYPKFRDVMAAQMARTPKWDDGPWAPKFDALIERYNKAGSTPLPRR